MKRLSLILGIIGSGTIILTELWFMGSSLNQPVTEDFIRLFISLAALAACFFINKRRVPAGIALICAAVLSRFFGPSYYTFEIGIIETLILELIPSVLLIAAGAFTLAAKDRETPLPSSDIPAPLELGKRQRIMKRLSIIFGIIGSSIVLLPAITLTVYCAYILMMPANEAPFESQGYCSFFIWLGVVFFVISLPGFIGSLFVRAKPKTAGVLMTVSGAVLFPLLIPTILLIAGGILAFTADKAPNLTELSANVCNDSGEA